MIEPMHGYYKKCCHTPDFEDFPISCHVAVANASAHRDETGKLVDNPMAWRCNLCQDPDYKTYEHGMIQGAIDSVKTPKDVLLANAIANAHCDGQHGAGNKMVCTTCLSKSDGSYAPHYKVFDNIKIPNFKQFWLQGEPESEEIGNFGCTKSNEDHEWISPDDPRHPSYSEDPYWLK